MGRVQDLLDAVRMAIGKDEARRKGEAALAELKERFATLTMREREVLTFVAQGRLNNQIAADLGLSEVTVKVHRGQVMRKMGAVPAVSARIGIVTAARNQFPPEAKADVEKFFAEVQPLTREWEQTVENLNAQILKLSQNPAREPRDSDLDIPQAERDSLRVLGIAASGLSDSDYAWAREQAWAYLAMVSRGDEPTGDAEWIAMMQAREPELKKYEFVIAEG